MKIILVAGARPNFIKMCPLVNALKKSGEFELVIVHTGQHYDEEMSEIFFDQLSIPKPDYNLGVGGGTHARQTAEIMIRFEEVLVKERANLLIVFGDVNSTLEVFDVL